MRFSLCKCICSLKQYIIPTVFVNKAAVHMASRVSLALSRRFIIRLSWNVHCLILNTASSLDIFENNCLQATNQLRRRHGVPDLTWSNTLAADAQAWANRLANSNVFQHDYISMQAKNQGENLAYFKPFKRKCQGPKRDDCVQCAEIVDDWYDEVKNYDFDLGKAKTPSGVVMHFTQVPVCMDNASNFNSFHYFY